MKSSAKIIHMEKNMEKINILHGDENASDSSGQNKPLSSQKRWYHVNVVFLPVKAAYFFDTAKKMGHLPFQILFLTSFGLTNTESGIILGLGMIGKIFGVLLWGILADKWKCHRLLTILTCVASNLTIVGQLFAGMSFAVNEEAAQCKLPIIRIRDQNMALNSTFSKTTLSPPHLPIVNSTVSTTVTITLLLTTNPADAYSSAPALSPITTAATGDEFGALFTAMLILSVMNLFFDCSLEMLDTGTIRKIQLYSSDKRKVNYGGQRCVGPIGAMLGSFVSNLSTQFFPQGSMSCYTGMVMSFMFFSMLTLISTLLTYRGLSFERKAQYGASADVEVIQECSNTDGKSELMSSAPNKDCKLDEINSSEIMTFELVGKADSDKEKENQMCVNNNTSKKIAPKSSDTGRRFLKTLLRADISFLMVSTAISGMFFSPMISFSYLLLRELNASPIMFSVVICCAATGAMFAFRFSNKIVKTLTPLTTLIACYTCASFVHLLYGMSRTPLLPVLSRPFIGFSRCLALTAGMTYLKEHCPVQILTSIVSFYVLMFDGVGPGIGLTVSGKVFGVYNGKTLFCGLAVFTLCWTFVILIYAIVNARRNKQ